MVARQARFGRRRDRTRARLARTTRRIAMARRDWHHQVSRRIAEGAHTVAIEDLKVKAMTASARGTAEEPGSGVKQKAGLNRVVLDTGWAALRAMLEYKAGRVIAVDPRHTSQTCAACGHVDARSRRTRDRFHCVACGHADHADANAARTIRRRGQALLHGEAAGMPGPPRGDSRTLDIRVPGELARFVAPKGSVALDGVSLTVNEVTGADCSINVIPHTLEATTLGSIRAGGRLNVEMDMIARYVARLMQSGKGAWNGGT